MTAQDLTAGMKAIDDPEIREKVAAGDLSAAGNLDLTDEESSLLRGAADDYPDVAGFSFEVFQPSVTNPELFKWKFEEVPEAYGQAAAYSLGKW